VIVYSDTCRPLLLLDLYRPGQRVLRHSARWCHPAVLRTLLPTLSVIVYSGTCRPLFFLICIAQAKGFCGILLLNLYRPGQRVLRHRARSAYASYTLICLLMRRVVMAAFYTSVVAHRRDGSIRAVRAHNLLKG